VGTGRARGGCITSVFNIPRTWIFYNGYQSDETTQRPRPTTVPTDDHDNGDATRLHFERDCTKLLSFYYHTNPLSRTYLYVFVCDASRFTHLVTSHSHHYLLLADWLHLIYHMCYHHRTHEEEGVWLNTGTVTHSRTPVWSSSQ
jgi:hypothetical protein